MQAKVAPRPVPLDSTEISATSSAAGGGGAIPASRKKQDQQLVNTPNCFGNRNNELFVTASASIRLTGRPCTRPHGTRANKPMCSYDRQPYKYLLAGSHCGELGRVAVGCWFTRWAHYVEHG